MRKRIKDLFILTVVFIFSLSSCRKDTTMVYNPEDPYYRESKIKTLAGQWDYIWHAMDNQYVFWDIDATNWDALHDDMYDKFERLDKLIDSMYTEFMADRIPFPDFMYGTEEVIASFMESEFSRALETLVDQHLKIKFYNRFAENSHTFRPGLANLKKRSDYHPSVTHSVAVEEDSDYSGFDYIYDGIVRNFKVEPCLSYSYEDETLWAYSCLLEESIAYLRTGSCSLSDPSKLGEIYDAVIPFFNNIRNMKEEGTLRGIILDFRGNTGGLAEDLAFFPGIFTQDTFIFSKQRTKIGLGRYDYTPWNYVKINPNTEDRMDIGNIPIIILQDMYSASLGELTGYAFTLSVPSAVTIGERSLGATGMLLLNCPDISHTGSANYQGDVSIYSSTYDSRYFNRENGCWESFEGIGFEPDIYCPLDYDGLAAGGRDTQLDCAVEYIYSQND